MNFEYPNEQGEEIMKSNNGKTDNFQMNMILARLSNYKNLYSTVEFQPKKKY